MENNLIARCTVTINNETIADTVTNINDSKEISNPLVIGPVNEDGDCIVRCDYCYLPVFCISGMLFCSVSKRTGRGNRESWI